MPPRSIGPTAAMYEECTFLARNFTSISFDRYLRESNPVAHLLACTAEEYSVYFL